MRMPYFITLYCPPFSDGTFLICVDRYVNNLPVDVMRNQMQVNRVIACEVGSTYSADLVPFGDAVSGSYVLWKNYFSGTKKFASSSEIQARLSYMHNEVNIIKAKETEGVILIEPQVSHYGMLEWKSYDAIEAVGRATAAPILDSLLQKWQL